MPIASLTPSFSTLRTQQGPASVDPVPLTLANYPLSAATVSASDRLLVYWTGEKVALVDTLKFEVLVWDESSSRWLIRGAYGPVAAETAFIADAEYGLIAIRIAAVSVVAVDNVVVRGAAVLPPPNAGEVVGVSQSNRPLSMELPGPLDSLRRGLPTSCRIKVCRIIDLVDSRGRPDDEFGSVRCPSIGCETGLSPCVWRPTLRCDDTYSTRTFPCQCG